MRRTRRWAQAIWLGWMAGLFIWIASHAILVAVGMLVQGELVVLLRIVLVPLLACTAPLWIIGGLLWLAGAHRSPGQQERRAANTEDGSAEDSGPHASNAGRRGRAFRRSWSRGWQRLEQGVVDWFILSPALHEQRFETAGRDNGYLRRYLRGWLLGSISLVAMLTLLGAGARAKIEPGDTWLQGYFVAVTLVEFALGGCLCSLLLARYVVTDVLLKRMEGMEAGA